MSLDQSTLEALRQTHPAWRLLASPHAPLVASFLHRAFVATNQRVIAQADLVELLVDDLFALRERLGEEAYPRSALDYINEWSANDKGWLRKFYPPGSDEPHYDLTPPTERAIAWLGTLTERPFVGTESRLLTLFELLRQISLGSNADPGSRTAELRRRRDEIDTEIARVAAGDVPMLDETAIKDRFQQFTSLARELLADFREVEHNFRALDRRVREQVAMWEGGKGALLEEIMGERDAIGQSDQGKSFRAFWDFLMSARRQEELSTMLERVLQLPPVASLGPDSRIRRIHYDWLAAGEHTQRTVAQLSQQLRRFLDDRAWLENRRIMEILHGIESNALALRGQPPSGDITDIADTAVDIKLPMERPLFNPADKVKLAVGAIDAGEGEVDAEALFSQFVIDKARLAANIRQCLQEVSQVTLRELCERHPLEKGLAELVAYLELAGEHFKATIDESVFDEVAWSNRRARMPRVIYVR